MSHSITLVSHCFCYSRLLCWQLSSLITNPPQCSVRIEVWHTTSDSRTVACLRWFAGQTWPANITLAPRELPDQQLFRRAIGRNLSALATTADFLWLADCDHLFGPGCLDSIPQAIAASGKPDAPLFFPRIVHKTTHETGDSMIASIDAPRIVHFPPEDFAPERLNRAIGGIMIVPGDIARTKGYLPTSRRYQRPATTWKRTTCDVAYRNSLGVRRGVAIDLQGVYRITHSQQGRNTIGLEL